MTIIHVGQEGLLIDGFFCSFCFALSFKTVRRHRFPFTCEDNLGEKSKTDKQTTTTEEPPLFIIF